MNAPPSLAFLFPLLALSACHSGGFDAEDVCEQTAACLEVTDGIQATDADIGVCTDQVESQLDGVSDGARERLDDAYDACANRTSCDFFVCFCDETDASTPECDRARAEVE